ncbi:AraC family transcriptional regulator [Methylobacterium sp. GXS13]|uniref:helix-turn-helix domain-containing protein n=1 Tax=Methylobacterium sp. GXS13 TaxID=1730094 RepID=UPI00071B8D5D|nr:helix-turn-helix domain-containing protein [Methylobacterium sp. GXS13]KST58134.1 AraC family transcriptional regulator [Methylobacterium sp. GXS13]
MQTIFSTDEVRPKDRFRHWRDVCEDRLVPMEQDCLGEGQFDATIDGASIGGLDFTKFALRNLRASTTPRTLRHENHKTDHLFMSMVLSGTVRADQNDRSSTDTNGDFAIRDTNTPWTIEHSGYSEVLAIAIPRERLEGVLGSARIFAGLTVEGHLPVATLARSFLSNLLREEDRLPPHVAERMAGVGIDLVVASLAERLARELPRPVHGSVVIQRAKAYVEANLHDQALDPRHLAAATGVSLRRLQELFHERGQHISDWIWQRRLEAAANRLTDPGYLHMPLGTLAYGCGFASQAHFSRRFKERYGLSPRDYRHRALSHAVAC